MHRRQHKTLVRRGPVSSRGFSIVELLVAMMLVAVGILALVGANTMLVRRRGEARQRLAAVTLAANRLSQLANGRCAATSGSSSSGAALSEWWTVELRGNATREIADSVRFGNRPVRTLVLRTRLPC